MCKTCLSKFIKQIRAEHKGALGLRILQSSEDFATDGPQPAHSGLYNNNGDVMQAAAIQTADSTLS